LPKTTLNSLSKTICWTEDTLTSKFEDKFNPLAVRLRTLCPLRSNLW